MVTEIAFQYISFDMIICPSNIQKLKQFKKLKKLHFSDNNIHSFIQISKLEYLPHLASLSIHNNDIANNSVILRSFIVYRFPSILEINGRPTTDRDRLRARQQF